MAVFKVNLGPNLVPEENLWGQVAEVFSVARYLPVIQLTATGRKFKAMTPPVTCRCFVIVLSSSTTTDY